MFIGCTGCCGCSIVSADLTVFSGFWLLVSSLWVVVLDLFGVVWLYSVLDQGRCLLICLRLGLLVLLWLI